MRQTLGPSGKRGGQRKFSDQAIETALVLRLVFKLPLRQAEGFLRSILSLMDIDLEAPDHTTLSRRGQHLNVRLDRVWCKNSADRLGGPPFVVVEDPTQPFMADDRRIHVDHAQQFLYRPVVEPLMIPLNVIMLRVFLHRVA